MNEFILNSRVYEQFKALIYEKSGINLGDNKEALLKARLTKRLRTHNLSNFEDYYKIVKKDNSGNEINWMLNAISTNVTSFFREPKHFEFIRSEFLPGFIKKTGHPDNNCLKIWSAGCSTGEEPYSIAICLDEYKNSKGRNLFSYRILATDLSTNVLEKARSGIYSHNSIKNIPANHKQKYFQKGLGSKSGQIKIKMEIQKTIIFRQLNLMNSFSFSDKQDIIFCRNVLIYFNEKDQENIISRFYKTIKPFGYLFIGHSESLMKYKTDFKYLKPTIYIKAP